MKTLTWTKELPSEVGFYWCRRPGPFKDDPIEISVKKVRMYAGKFSIDNSSLSVDAYNTATEWAGPIKPPQEP